MEKDNCFFITLLIPYYYRYHIAKKVDFYVVVFFFLNHDFNIYRNLKIDFTSLITFNFNLIPSCTKHKTKEPSLYPFVLLPLCNKYKTKGMVARRVKYEKAVIGAIKVWLFSTFPWMYLLAQQVFNYCCPYHARTLCWAFPLNWLVQSPRTKNLHKICNYEFS